MTYGLKDLYAPYIFFNGSLGECYREARGLALCAIYRQEANDWHRVAIRYYSSFILAKNIINPAAAAAKEPITCL